MTHPLEKAVAALWLLILPLLAFGHQGSGPVAADFVKPLDNLVLEGVPPIPAALAEETARYGESRSAALFDWHPARREVLIGTRFADTAQVHAVAMPGGSRRQLTFFPDRVAGARYLPDGRSFVFQKDSGGGEWYQLYRHDGVTGQNVLLTDGHSRQANYLLAHHSTQMVYTSTQRNRRDADLWIMDAAGGGVGAGEAHLLIQVEGGGWAPLSWSPDNRRLVVVQALSANESYLWLVDAASGARTLLTPGPDAAAASGAIAYDAAVFAPDGTAIYVLTDRDSEFKRLARIDLKTLQTDYLTTDIHWDVDDMAASEDGRSIAFVTDEDGYSALHVLDIASRRYRTLAGIPRGVISSLRFHPNGHDLGFSLTNAQVPGDVFSVDIRSGRLERWTAGETGGLDPGTFVSPVLVKWKSFDGLEISGFLYQPDPARYPGRRPVIVSIHGGPEAQERPGYRGQLNYLVNELGVAIVAPNVRGSAGFGKTYLKLDNGFHREDTYKDINALFDWIGTQPLLDPARVMVTGGSYGGHMTWAIAAFYGDRIRCALPVVGMSNLVTFLEHTEEYRRDLRRVEYGDERDPAMRDYLERIAPMNHLDTMRKPVFAVVGRNDPRVPWTESRQIVDRLNAQGTPTWFMIANDEGHGYAKKKNRDYQFAATVLFIRQYLIGDVAAP